MTTYVYRMPRETADMEWQKRRAKEWAALVGTIQERIDVAYNKLMDLYADDYLDQRDTERCAVR